MKRYVMLGMVLGALSWAQEAAREATLADVVKALERIEAQIAEERALWKGEGVMDFGGGPLFPTRILVWKEEFQKYFEAGGSYEEAPRVLFPFANGGGGTWRFTFNQRLSVGLSYYGFGFSCLGFLHHSTDPQGPNATIDENGDGLDDYYSYAGYGLGMFSFVIAYRLPLTEDPATAAVFGGMQLGIGSESIGFSRYQRTSNVLANTLGIGLANLDWSRPLVGMGAWAGVDVGSRRVKLAVEGGVDYYLPLGGWLPASGMHRTDVKPASTVNALNFWFAIGPHFNY